MFTFVGGPYTNGITTISAETMNYLRGTYANALDIVDGGSWVAVTQSVITGTAGLKFNFSATGLQIGGLGGLHVLSGSTAYINSGGALVMSAGSTTTLASTAFFYIANSAEQIVQSGGQLTFASGGIGLVQSGATVEAQIGSIVHLYGTNTISGPTTFSGSAATTAWRLNAINAAAATATLTTTYDYHSVQNPSTAGNVDYTLKSTSPTPPTGAVMHVSAYVIPNGTTVRVLREGGAVITSAAGGVGTFCGLWSFVFNGTAWRATSISGNATLTYDSP